jgi:hypothetical protein
METHRLLPHVRERVRFHEIYAQWLSKANEQDCNQLDRSRAIAHVHSTLSSPVSAGFACLTGSTT